MASHPDWARERAYYAARTMRALELLAFGEHSSNELAETLGIHPRTARRVLTELASDDYLTQGGGRRRRYRTTLRLAALGRQTVAHTRWLRSAAPWVARLAAQTRHPAGLWLPCYTDVVCVLAAQPAGPLPQPELGRLSPAHASAPGKALLAYRPRWRDSLLAQPLERHTNRTLTDPRDLAADLDRIRARGHATDHGEHHPQLHALAAPAFLADDPLAALSTMINANDTALSTALNDTAP
jgi:DNA-binding IclR family transcriptional regulator